MKSENQNQAADALSRLETDRSNKALLEEDITEVVIPLVQHIDCDEVERNGSLADQFCECEICYVTFGVLQNALKEVVANVQAGGN